MITDEEVSGGAATRACRADSHGVCGYLLQGYAHDIKVPWTLLGGCSSPDDSAGSVWWGTDPVASTAVTGVDFAAASGELSCSDLTAGTDVVVPVFLTNRTFWMTPTVVVTFVKYSGTWTHRWTRCCHYLLRIFNIYCLVVSRSLSVVFVGALYWL